MDCISSAMSGSSSTMRTLAAIVFTSSLGSDRRILDHCSRGRAHLPVEPCGGVIAGYFRIQCMLDPPALTAAQDSTVQMIDTSVVRVHQHAACIADSRNEAVGRSRGGLTSKLHVVVDGRGLPLRLGNRWRGS
jgi:hypothetical protein